MHFNFKRLVQKPQVVTPCGLGNDKCTFIIPQHMFGHLGYLASQIKDPFEKISKDDLKKRKVWRKDYL